MFLNKRLHVLCACEESQTVTKAFRAFGHYAFSCDLQPCSGGCPQWHFQGDVRKILYYKWDLIIAFPPCTYLSNVGNSWLYAGGFNHERYELGLKAKDFFMLFYNYPGDHVAIENPVPSSVYNLPKYSQIIYPYYFGHDVSKRTCLWLRGVPPLMPTCHILNYVTTDKASFYQNGSKRQRQINRSKFFPGVALAMARQWGGVGCY